MKNFKKFIALTCVAAMLVPTVAFADDVVSPSSTGGGDSVIENDNSTAPNYTAVELPTTTSNTYDFSIDRDKLLADYDYEGTYDPTSHVYFNVQKDAATLIYPDNDTEDTTTYALYKKEYDVDTKQADDDDTTEVDSTFITALDTPTADDDYDTAKGKLSTETTYYVWGPWKATDDEQKAVEGRGKYIQITAANIEEIVEIVDNGNSGFEYVLKKNHDSGAFIWDGNVYEEKYTLVDDEAAVAFIKAEKVTDSDTYTLTYKGETLYLGTNDGSDITYAAVDTDDLKYTPATTQYKDTSDAAKVVNKSTTPIVVSVQINMTNDTGITYATADDVSATDTASLYLAITDGTNSIYVENSTATAYYVLDGAINKNQRYQIDGDPIEATGSHAYARYELPNPTYDEQAFQIVADVNESNDADGAWQAYIDSLTAEQDAVLKPTIQVVYSWEKVDKTETANTFEGEMGNLYETDGTTGWVNTFSKGGTTLSGATVTRGTVDGIDYELTFTKGTTFTATLDFAEGVTGVTKVCQGDTPNATGTTSTVTVKGTTLTIGSAMWGSQSAGAEKYITLTFNNGDVMNIKVTIAQ